MVGTDRYERMRYRRCGRSGLLLPEVSLGLWQAIGSYTDEAIARQTVMRAFELGVTHFDLANNYGSPPGTSERLLGQWLADLPRDELVISSKAGYRMGPGPYGEWGSKKYLISSCEASLKRLGLDYVDIFYSHRFDPETPLDETLGALEQLVRQGKALYVGVSNYAGKPFADALSIVERKDWTPLLVNQPRYNLLNRDAEQGVLPLADQHGVGVAVFSPLAQGMLTDRYLNGIPEGSRASHSGGWLRDQLDDTMVGALRALDGIAEGRGQSLAQMALAWVLRDPRVTTVITGASRPAQIEQSVQAIRNTDFADDELAAIDAALAVLR